MNIPKFTAQASLHRTGNRYRSLGYMSGPQTTNLTPQLFRGSGGAQLLCREECEKSCMGNDTPTERANCLIREKCSERPACPTTWSGAWIFCSVEGWTKYRSNSLIPAPRDNAWMSSDL